MSWSAEIFLNAAPSLEALSGDIGRLLSIYLRRIADGTETKYEYRGADFELSIYGDHGMENDRDMNFEDYAYQISFRRLNPPNREQAQANTLKFAWSAFAKLKETGRYALMLVENGQRKLASFDPDFINVRR
jgi:hypothetical protein